MYNIHFIDHFSNFVQFMYIYVQFGHRNLLHFNPKGGILIEI